RDRGVGIEPGSSGQIFDVFTQADCSLDRSRGGLGLGLSVAKGLLELHGGTIEAASEGVGRGAEFTLRLPCQEEPPALSGGAPPPRGVRPRLRVLVVE